MYTTTTLDPWDSTIVVVVERLLLFKGHLCNKSLKWDLQNIGRYRQVVAIQRWSLAQV